MSCCDGKVERKGKLDDGSDEDERGIMVKEH